MSLTEAHLQRLARVAQARGKGFVELVRLADLDPATAFRGGVLRGDLRGEDLRGFDFTGAEFRGCDLRGADLSHARGVTHEMLDTAQLDETTKLPRRLHHVRARIWRRKRRGTASSLPTGLRDLDGKTGGLHPSNLVILAGRPGMGKTALATRIAVGAAKALQAEAQMKNPSGVHKAATVAIFSLEMRAGALATRLVSQEARVPGDKIRSGHIGRKDFDKYTQASRDISSLSIQIDDTPAITLPALHTRCRRLKRTVGLALVIVDYLQLMRPAAGPRPESRVLEISMVTQELKAFAKELAVPVLALAQLPRQLENRDDKQPQLSDLRELGSIEQDADVVLFLHRGEHYLEQEMPKEVEFEGNGRRFNAAMKEWQQRLAEAHNLADLIIAKQSYGPVCTVPLLFEKQFGRFDNIDFTHQAIVSTELVPRVG